ncbi:MAG: ion transporter [Phycisphaeraceae bacterium]
MAALKKRVYAVLEGRDWADGTTRIVNGLLIGLIVANVISLMLESMAGVRAQFGETIRVFDAVSVVIFTVEWLLRVWSSTASPRYVGAAGRVRFAMTPMALIDLLAILPFWLPMVGLDLRVLRILRLFRLFRILKLARYSQALQTFGRVVTRKREELITLLMVLGVLLLIASSLMYYVEHEAQPEAFSSIPATMWWGIATLTTVGYGDVYPITTGGKLLGSVIAVLGIGMFALPTGILGAAFVDELAQRRLREGGQDSAGSEDDTPDHCPHCGKSLKVEREAVGSE